VAGNIDAKPAFQAEKITGKFHRMVTHIIEDVRKVGPNQDKSIITRKLQPVREEFDTAWMIYFPQGHSILVADDDTEQLMSIGVLEGPKMIDMNSGEEIPQNYNLTPKEVVEQSQRRSRPRTTGGLTQVMEGNLDG
jgi:hypothetical protein